MFIVERKKITLFLLFSLLFLGLFSVGYATLAANPEVSGTVTVKVENEMRITNIEFAYGLENASPTNTDNTGSFDIKLPNLDSYVMYTINILKKGSINKTLYDITGLPEGVKVEVLGYDYGSNICGDDGCAGGTTNLTIKFSYDETITEVDPNSDEFQFQANFDFRSIFCVDYIGFENTQGFATSVIEGTDYQLNYELDETEYFKVTMGTISLIAINFYENGCLSIPTVTGDLVVEIALEDILTDKELVGSITKYGITLSSEGNGIYSIDGTTTSTIYARLSDKLVIATANKDLVTDDAPNDKTILEKGKYYALEFTVLGGTHNVDKNNMARFVFRKTNKVEGYQLFGYDLFSGFFGSTTTPLEDDLGMYSIYIVKNYTFDNFRFKIHVYEIFPEDILYFGEKTETIDFCGAEISYYGTTKVYEIVGTTTVPCYLNFETFESSDVAFDTTGMPIKYQEGKQYKIKYEYIMNRPTTTGEISLTFRTQDNPSVSINKPKASSYTYDFSGLVEVSNVLTYDSPMFSLYVSRNMTFYNYAFKASVISLD